MTTEKVTVEESSQDARYPDPIGIEDTAQGSFGSSGKDLPDHIPMVREELVPPKPNEVRAESELDKLPRPSGWKILIIPYAQPRMSQG